MKVLYSFCLGLTVIAGAAWAGLPMPCINYSGLLVDEYGSPILKNAAVEFVVIRASEEYNVEWETNRYDRHLISGLIAPGVNFQLQLEMDSAVGTTNYYADYAVHKGDVVTLLVEVNGKATTVFPIRRTTIVAGNPGDHVWLNLFTGSDVDEDGLSDSWEELLMSQSGGYYTNIQQITASEDFDGDGASNGHEFLAGTFPFLANDVFAIRDAEIVDGRICFEFLSVNGKVYQPSQSTNLVNSTWSTALFSVEQNREANRSSLLGDGRVQTIYIDVDDNSKYVRMTTE